MKAEIKISLSKVKVQATTFKFNINLTGNLGPILNAIAKGRKISNDLLSRTWRLQR